MLLTICNSLVTEGWWVQAWIHQHLFEGKGLEHFLHKVHDPLCTSLNNAINLLLCKDFCTTSNSATFRWNVSALISDRLESFWDDTVANEFSAVADTFSTRLVLDTLGLSMTCLVVLDVASMGLVVWGIVSMWPAALDVASTLPVVLSGFNLTRSERQFSECNFIMRCAKPLKNIFITMTCTRLVISFYSSLHRWTLARYTVLVVASVIFCQRLFGMPQNGWLWHHHYCSIRNSSSPKTTYSVTCG